jgi:hypothetical protein
VNRDQSAICENGAPRPKAGAVFAGAPTSDPEKRPLHAHRTINRVAPVCIACQIQGDGWAAYEAAVLIGGPIAYAGYRRVRRALGLPDTAAVPDPAPPVRPGRTQSARPAGRAPARTSCSIVSTTSAQN